jgi:hypothetical protein
MYCAISLQTRRQLSCSFSQYMGPIPAHEREKVEYDAIVSHGDVQTFIKVRPVLSFDCALDGLLLLSLPLAVLCSVQRHEAAAPYRLTPPLMPSHHHLWRQQLIGCFCHLNCAVAAVCASGSASSSCTGAATCSGRDDGTACRLQWTTTVP